MATVMTQQSEILAEAIEKALEIIERNLMNTIDARFDAAALPDDIVPISEEKIREIATEEAENTVNGATIDISA
jgi:hypothetical protein